MLNDKLLKVSLGAIALLIILGFFTIQYVLNDGTNQPMYTSSPPPQKATNISTDPKEVSLDTIYINIRSPKYKIMKADIALVVKNQSSKKVLQGNMESVRNAVLQYLNAMDSSGLETNAGKERLKEELTEMLESSFGQPIETIYLKNFILSP